MAVPRARRVGGWGAVAVAVPVLWIALATPAAAHTSSVPVRLGLTGMVTSATPHGAWSISVRRGDVLELLAGGVPGVETLAGDSGDSQVKVRVSADASEVPGGGGNRMLDTNKPYRFTVARTGKFALHWSVDFLVDKGHGKSGVAATRYFAGTIQVAQPAGSGGSGGSGGGSGETGSGAGGAGGAAHGGSNSGSPAGNGGAAGAAPTAHVPSPVAKHVGPRSAGLGPAPTPTISLAPDLGTSARPRPPVLALPMQSAADTFLLTAVGGTLALGVLWLLWVASIKPILGR